MPTSTPFYGPLTFNSQLPLPPGLRTYTHTMLIALDPFIKHILASNATSSIASLPALHLTLVQTRAALTTSTRLISRLAGARLQPSADLIQPWADISFYGILSS